MLPYLRAGGRVIANGDDDMLSKIPGALLYGRGEKCAVRGTEIEDQILRGMRFTANYEGTQCRMHVPSLGVHSVYNALAAVSVGLLLGMELVDIAAGIETYEPLRGRMNVHELPRYTVIDDTYNANPTSTKASLDVLAKCAGRRVAILGDMRELGVAAPQMHADIGRYAASLGIERILCVGKESVHLFRAAKSVAPDCADYFETQDALLVSLHEFIAQGDVILVKASRGMYLEKTVELLLTLGNA
jgi:UDP-N-acetylmuramoyl-tripeptide--D-alanyl-D-alanine ligase